MSLFRPTPPARHALVTGVLVALTIIATSALLGGSALAAAVFPALWVVLQARRRACPRASA